MMEDVKSRRCGCWRERGERESGYWLDGACSGGKLELCHFDGRAVDGHCALIESQPEAPEEQWIMQEG